MTIRTERSVAGSAVVRRYVWPLGVGVSSLVLCLLPMPYRSFAHDTQVSALTLGALLAAVVIGFLATRGQRHHRAPHSSSGERYGSERLDLSVDHNSTEPARPFCRDRIGARVSAAADSTGRDIEKGRGVLHATLEAIRDAVITTDRKGCVEWMNPVAEQFTGWSRDESRGRPLDEVLRFVDEANREPVPDLAVACLRQGNGVSRVEQAILISRDSREYEIEGSASPIRDTDGNVQGALLLLHDVSSQRRLTREMRHRATHDAMTGLTNRAEFESRLHRLIVEIPEGSAAHAMMYIDLDRFKVINDVAGHAAGDELLREISAVLQKSVRGRDTVARLGGDEFGVILEHCGIDRAHHVARTICRQIGEVQFLHDGRRFRVGASIGVVPVDVRWRSVAAALQAADSSCYAAKDAGRNRIHLWLDSDAGMAAGRGESRRAKRIEQAIDGDGSELLALRVEPSRRP